MKVKPDEQNFTHMELSNGQLRNNRPASHPSITLNANIKSIVNDKISSRAPKAAARHT